MPVEYNDTDTQLAQLIRDMLNAERRRAITQHDIQQAELSELITKEEGDLRNESIVDAQFDDYLNKLSPDEKPESRISASRMMVAWTEDRQKQIDALRNELSALQREPVNETEIFSRVQDRLNHALTEASREVRQYPDTIDQQAQSETPNAVASEQNDSRRRRPRGETLPQRRYHYPILLTLLRMGGKGRTSNVIDQVGDILKDEFTPRDLERDRSGLIVWQHRMHSVYQQLKKEGLVDPNSPRGIWRLSAAGRERAERCAQGSE